VGFVGRANPFIEGFIMTVSEETYRKVKELTGCNTRVLNYKYLGPTNFKGSRVKITDKRFKRSKTISYDHQFSNAVEVAVNYLLSHGWDVVGTNSDACVIIMGSWNSDKQL
tara:strand:+ start:35 stop:367 length:333 start_codon:yes stop_codon:yes gene_type:complete